jgi:hypothetical protein
LQTLGLNNNEVTDAALQALREVGLLHALSWASGKDGQRPTGPNDVVELDLSFSKITNAGLKHVAEFKQLQTLKLYLTPIGDAGLMELAGLQQLQTLDLNSTKVSDQGLKELARLPRLHTLSLGGTKVSDAGVAELRKALPKLEVFR